jgi:hypothetical protein
MPNSEICGSGGSSAFCIGATLVAYRENNHTDSRPARQPWHRTPVELSETRARPNQMRAWRHGADSALRRPATGGTRATEGTPPPAETDRRNYARASTRTTYLGLLCKRRRAPPLDAGVHVGSVRFRWPPPPRHGLVVVVAWWGSGGGREDDGGDWRVESDRVLE